MITQNSWSNNRLYFLIHKAESVLHLRRFAKVFLSALQNSLVLYFEALVSFFVEQLLAAVFFQSDMSQLHSSGSLEHCFTRSENNDSKHAADFLVS